MSMVKLLRHCGGRADSRGDGQDGGGRRVAGSPRDVGDAGGGCSHSTFSMAWMEGRVGQRSGDQWGRAFHIRA